MLFETQLAVSSPLSDAHRALISRYITGRRSSAPPNQSPAKSSTLRRRSCSDPLRPSLLCAAEQCLLTVSVCGFVLWPSIVPLRLVLLYPEGFTPAHRTEDSTSGPVYRRTQSCARHRGRVVSRNIIITLTNNSSQRHLTPWSRTRMSSSG
jgi:hypothetical protein